MNWTFPFCRIFGIPVRMHWLLLIMIVGYMIRGLSLEGWWGFQWVSVTMAILLVSVLFHELAHCFMAIRLGAGAEQILLWPLGGLAYVGHTGSSRDEIKITGIGPLSSFFLGGASLAILVLGGARWQWEYLDPFHGWWYRELTTAQNFLLHSFRLNTILGLFNLLIPAYPLDGGRILFAFLTIRYGRQSAALITANIAIPIGLAMGIWGIAQNELMLILIGAMVLIDGFQLRHLVRIGELEAHPAFSHGAPEYEYMPDRPRKKGWLGRWRERRAQRRALRAMEREQAAREKIDAVLEKVSRDGMASLTPKEKKLLEEASRRTRGGGVMR